MTGKQGRKLNEAKAEDGKRMIQGLITPENLEKIRYYSQFYKPRKDKAGSDQQPAEQSS